MVVALVRAGMTTSRAAATQTLASHFTAMSPSPTARAVSAVSSAGRQQRRRALLPRPHAAEGGVGAGAASAVTIKVGGMVCDGCSGRVEAALKAAPGVASAAVDLKSGMATVVPAAGAAADGAAAATAAAALVALIEGLGFEAELQPQ